MACYDAFAQCYDLFLDDVDYGGRAAYFDRIITERVGKRGLLLDLACGTGSLSIELSRLGYEVIGADGSEQMLCEAQRKAWDAGEKILYLHQQMEELDLYGTIDACVCALDSLNHLAGARALEQAIGRVSLFLAPGGVFVFDMNTPYKHQKILADHCFVYEKDQTVCVWQNKTKGLCTRISLDFFREDKDGRYTRTEERFSERAYSIPTIERIVARCGLAMQAVYAADTFTAPGESDERVVFVACKPDTETKGATTWEN
ncbi:MAG: class I SAM-dependent methyltransferase [Oscillospiraceae bacterium]